MGEDLDEVVAGAGKELEGLLVPEGELVELDEPVDQGVEGAPAQEAFQQALGAAEGLGQVLVAQHLLQARRPALQRGSHAPQLTQQRHLVGQLHSPPPVYMNR